MSESKDYVEVTVKVPKKIVEFLRDIENSMGMTMEEYLEYNIIDDVRSDIEAIEGPLFSRDEIVKRYGLKEFLEDC